MNVKNISSNKTIESLNLGGTSITSNGVLELARSKNDVLKSVNIEGCKKLKQSDSSVLIAAGLDVTAGEDVFRFYLKPDKFSEFKSINTSVLKT